MPAIRRKFQTYDVTVPAETHTSEVIELGEAESAALYFPATFPATASLVYWAEKRDGTFALAEDKDGSSVALASIAKGAWRELPEAMMAMHSVRVYSADTSADVQTIKVALKG